MGRSIVWQLSLSLILLGTLNACGGGGDDSSTSGTAGAGGTTTTTTTTAATPTSVDFQGTYPAPGVVVFAEKNGTTPSVTAYPGQVEVFFAATTDAATAIKTVEGLGGKILAQLPDYGYYLVEVKVGSESSFITSLRTANSAADAYPHGISKPSIASVNGKTAAIDAGAFPVPGGASSTVIDCFGSADTHGPLVVQSDKDNGGNVGLQVDVSGSGCQLGIANHDIGKAIILTNAASNKVAPGGPVIINISSGGGPNDHDSVNDCGSLGAGCTAELNNLASWFNVLKSKLYFIRAIPAAQRKNVLVTAALGNGSMDVSLALDLLRQQYPDLADVMDSNLILVSSTGDSIPASTARPSGTYSNTASAGDHDVVNFTGLIKNSSGALVDAGTSFASPRVEAIAEQLYAATPGITTAQVIQAIKRADELPGGLTLAGAKAQAKIVKDLAAAGAAISISGMVTDSKTGAALGGAKLLVVATQGSSDSSYIGFSTNKGSYALDVPVALRDQTASVMMQASRAGYVPKAIPVTLPTGTSLTASYNVALEPLGSDTIVVDTTLHHLGDGLATTSLNAGLQLLSAEGLSLSKAFSVDAGQLPPAYTKATLTYAVNGAECADPIKINGTQVVALTNSAVGAQSLSSTFSIALLKSGSNTLTVTASPSCGAGLTGYDDFEISNIVIRLAK